MEKLLLHICCAPDAAVVVERMRTTFDISGFFYNPNIHPQQEYQLRLQEMERLATKLRIPLIPASYDSENWITLTRGMEQIPEGGERCRVCFEMRLEQSAQVASQNGFALFSTVLTVSPHKNAGVINELGRSISRKYSVSFFEANFKQRDGFKRSLELSKIFNLYRQDYCGCIFSKKDRLRQ